jgi:hypothetical protein
MRLSDPIAVQFRAIPVLRVYGKKRFQQLAEEEKNHQHGDLFIEYYAIPKSKAQAAMHDAFMGNHPITIKLVDGHCAYRFNCTIVSHKLSAEIGKLIMISIALRIDGPVHAN